ncbi:MepB family protein [Flavobacterium sp. DG1-102-2]|uniref:MepB family protein n=1 Tax=Flavobacterium sp. DG1-102-2 TaxID=3081663 RepID=UPI002949802A|nr:MepB family protein [Flavobacterium sp. DG1-102-2]MDV6166947.1 MepB family protein [Flavobacterium sp. DG1-102-2]
MYGKCRFTFENAAPEKESSEYDAYTFKLNGLNILFRSAKTTPTKAGQFVTLWKRLNGPILPFDSKDKIDFVVVNCRSENHFGQFVFPKSVLLKQGAFTTESKKGKRAMRVYPSWDIVQNVQAEKTQKWQLEYFIDFTNTIDIHRINNLYGFAI